VSRAIVSIAIAGALATLLGCTAFDVTPCGTRVCPGDLACCGQECVLPTCGDGELQTGEQCDTWTRRSCTSIGRDFGHIGCTATCALDERSCAGFGFLAGGLACDVARPANLAAADDTLWFGTRLNRAVRVTPDGCSEVALAGVPTRMLAMSRDEALAVYNPSALQVIAGDRAIDLAPAPPFVQSSAVIDPQTVVLGHSDGRITVVDRDAADWSTRMVTVTCGAGMVGRVDALARLGDHLVVVIAGTVPRLATFAVGALEQPTVVATCVDLTDLPYSPDFIAAPTHGDVAYLFGNATAADSTVTAIVVEVRVSAEGVVTAVARLGATGTANSAHLATLVPLQRGWIDPTGALHVASGSNALVLRDARWRRLDDPIGRGFGPTVTHGDVMVTATPASALVSRGFGFEIVDDLGVSTHPMKCPVTSTSCNVSAAGRARGTTWLLVTASPSNVRTVVRDGVPLSRQVDGITWAPLALATRDDTEWIAAGLPGRDELYLWRTADDAAPAPVASGCAVGLVDLELGPAAAIVATRVGRVDDLDCPRRWAVTRRSATSGVTETLWTTDEEVRQVAAPADGSASVLVLLVARDAAGAIMGHRIVEIDGSGLTHERASWSGTDDLRAMWAEDRDHAWLAGDRGRLVRFSDSEASDESEQLGSIAGATLRAVGGSGSSDVFVVGDNNLVFHHDGQAWTTVSPSSQVESFTTLAVDPVEVLLGAGDRVLALRVPRQPARAPSCSAP
jgi:hypothetical protein